MHAVTLYENYDLCLLDWSLLEHSRQNNIFHPWTAAAWCRPSISRGSGPGRQGKNSSSPVRLLTIMITTRSCSSTAAIAQLLRYSMTVPVAVNDTILRHPVFQQAVIERSRGGMEVELPSLPVIRFPPILLKAPGWFDNFRLLCG